VSRSAIRESRTHWFQNKGAVDVAGSGGDSDCKVVDGGSGLCVTTKRATFENETEMKYEWDEAKNRKNIAKHGFNFEDAERCFPGLASHSNMTVSTTGKNDSSPWVCWPDGR
jgi:hypothetical protein